MAAAWSAAPFLPPASGMYRIFMPTRQPGVRPATNIRPSCRSLRQCRERWLQAVRFWLPCVCKMRWRSFWIKFTLTHVCSRMPIIPTSICRRFLARPRDWLPPSAMPIPLSSPRCWAWDARRWRLCCRRRQDLTSTAFIFKTCCGSRRISFRPKRKQSSPKATWQQGRRLLPSVRS